MLEYGYTEGDVCNRQGCQGHIQLTEPEGCTCHISPPCSACVSVIHYCRECGWDETEEE